MQYTNRPLATFPAPSLSQEDSPSPAPEASTPTPQNLSFLPPRNLFVQNSYTQIPVAASPTQRVTTTRPFAKSNIALLAYARAGGL